MRNRIDRSQKLAIEIGDYLATKITTNQAISQVFIEKIKEINLNHHSTKNHADIVKEVLSGQDSRVDILNYQTLKCIAQRALKELLSTEDYQVIIKQCQKRGGRNSVKHIQELKGIKPISHQEKKLLNRIGHHPEGYKSNTIRNIEKIRLEIITIEPSRKKSTIKSYMSQFTNNKKELIPREEYPEEIATLQLLYKQCHKPYQKLPIEEITEELNRLHHHDRTTNAVANYIRVHFKDPEEKKIMTANLRSEEEKQRMQGIRDKRFAYTYPNGNYNLKKILTEYQKHFPQGTRTCKAFKSKLEKIAKEEECLIDVEA